MARTKRGTPPSYRRHSSGQACVTVRDQAGRRREILLGRWDSPESRAEYARILSELAANQGRLAAREKTAPPPTDLTINEVLVAYWRHAEQHYRRPDGTPTGELGNLKDALRPLRHLYGSTPARDFDSVALEALQDDLVRGGTLARTTINARINRVRRVFRWAVRKKLVPGEVLLSLDTVPGLQRGRTVAREPEDVRPVAWEHVEAALPHMPRPVAVMVRVQWLCGCRAGEVVIMRGCDLDIPGSVWIYRPAGHKNQHRGLGRIIYLGPQAQELLLPLLRVTCPCCGLSDRAYRLAWRSGLCGPCADRHDDAGIAGPWPEVQVDRDYFVFNPREYVEDLHARRAAQRASKRTPSELRRKANRAPGRMHAERYDRRTYRQAVVRACQKAGVPPWSPLQLRHARATEIRERYGLEASQCVLGHERADVTQLYAERNQVLAARIMAEIG